MPRKNKENTKRSASSKLDPRVMRMAWILVLGMLAPMMDSTMVNIAVDKLARDFHTNLNTIQWVITGFALAMGVIVPLSSWLTNRFDGKKVYLAAEAGFLVTSLACAVSWNVSSLIMFRLLQGACTGVLIPLMMNLLLRKVPATQFGRLWATISLPMILGPIIGPTIGGFIVQYASWRWLFWVNIFFASIACFFGWRILDAFPGSKPDDKLDPIGLVLLSGLSAFFIYGIVAAGEKATFWKASVITWLIAGILFSAAYLVYAYVRKGRALLPLSLFRYRNFDATVVGLFFAGLAINGPMLIFPLFFQNIRGMSVVSAGLALIPQGVGMLATRPMVGRLIDSIGAKWVAMVCLVIAVAGTLPFAFFGAHSNFWVMMAVLFVRGAGVGGVSMPLMSDAYFGLRKDEIPAATVATRTIQNIGAAFGSAVLAMIVTATLTNIGRTEHTANVQTIPHLTAAYQHSFVWATILCAMILFATVFMTDKRKSLAKQAARATS